MKVLIIDNNDSFTYNLKHYVNTFCDNIKVLRHYDANLKIIEDFDKILFSPGPGLPSEYVILYKILEKYQSSKSILGICLGHQAIAEFYGAKLYNLDTPLHAFKSKITHLDNCYLFKNLEQTSYNSDGIIMSLKHINYDVRGIQFHPESILSEYGLNIIKNWLSN